MSRGTWKWLPAVPAVYFLFFFALTDVGLIGPDEPRYAWIGREMARSGDWITPRLWGEPWFEKPALLYWMIGLAYRAGLEGELAARLPVAVLSVIFLVAYYLLLRAEFGRRPALFATAILGTSAGWLAFSHAAVTDLPMSAAFSAAMLMGLRWLSSDDRRLLAGAGAMLGLAVLAKGLVPLVLALPFVWASRRRLRALIGSAPLAVFVLTAAPWYVLCSLRHGPSFLSEFFGIHHFARFWSGVIHHPQPFWFFLPVLLAGLFPWVPLLALLFRKRFYSDWRRQFLLLWLLFGLVFFSASANKLPGYVLPLLPATAALAGIALAEAREARWVLTAACLLLLAIPLISGTLPRALAAGLSRARPEGWHWGFGLTFILLALMVWFWEEAGRREGAVCLLLLGVVVSVLFLKVKAFPQIDRLATARPIWRQIAPFSGQVCLDNVHRNWRYALNYYAAEPLPECSRAPRPIRVGQLEGKPPYLY